MFTTGQYIFAALFFIAFTILIVITYKKDKKLHLKNYTGVKWVALTFIIFIISLFFIKHFLKN
ncbi:hypothetical protein SAMN05660313_03141 [Cellulophaga fucicola]|uniref:Uncharacterized protein n=1 Tax=Cellulophaga fucicola TaxID=76595 RepID=A0A1K1R102_9FLAO|nr:hypothetical protein [Cellulophaga fucicola]SFW65531.1 hypothetical protein SAMN05660313_03141 [Cellulophaga fucicola]